LPQVVRAVSEVVVHADMRVEVHRAEEQEHHAAEKPSPRGRGWEVQSLGPKGDREEDRAEGDLAPQSAEEERLDDRYVADPAADRPFRRRGPEVEATERHGHAG